MVAGSKTADPSTSLRSGRDDAACGGRNLGLEKLLSVIDAEDAEPVGGGVGEVIGWGVGEGVGL